MIRAAVSTGLSCHGRLSVRRTILNAPRLNTLSASRRMIGHRYLSSESPKQDAKQEKKNPEDQNAIVLTPGEQVVAASRLGMWAGVAAFAAVCAYYIGRELLPT